MHYQNIYDSLCNTRKHRNLYKESGYEIHHIKPRSFGGDDSENNLVKFTYREHLLAHILLVRIHKNNTRNHLKMLKAAELMCNLNKSKIPPTRIYAQIRKEYMNNIDKVMIDRRTKAMRGWFDLNSVGKIKLVPSPTNRWFKRELRCKFTKSENLRGLVAVFKFCWDNDYKGVADIGNTYKGQLRWLERSGFVERVDLGGRHVGYSPTVKFEVTLKLLPRGYGKEGVLKAFSVGGTYQWNAQHTDKLLTRTRRWDGKYILKVETPWLTEDPCDEPELHEWVDCTEIKLILKNLYDRYGGEPRMLKLK